MAMSAMKMSKNYQSDGFGGYKQSPYGSNSPKGVGYSSNVYNSVSSSGCYNFKERGGRLKWKDIINLDIDGMVRNNDLTPLENYLDNLIFSTIDENDLQIVPEPSILKLLRIYQYTLEYLLYSQQKLEGENRIIETNYNQLIQDIMAKDNALKENKNVIKTLKKEKREKDMVVNTYKCVIDEYKTGGVKEQVKNYFYCKICTGKRFSSEEMLFQHHQRRHNLNNSDHSKKSGGIDDKLDQMKTYFETYIKSFQNDSYLKIFENQRNIEQRLNDIKYSQKNNDHDGENNFKHTLLEMKEFLLKSTHGANANQTGSNKVGEAESKQYHETMGLLKSQAESMNEMLVGMSKAQDLKIQSVMEQLNSFASNISEEFNTLKQQSLKQKEKKDKKREKEEEEKEERKPSPKKTFIPAVAQVESIEFRSVIKEPSQSVRSSVELPKNKTIALLKEHVKKEVKAELKKKQYFNAGRVETDNSEDETSRSISFKNRNGDLKKSQEKNESPFRRKNIIPEAEVAEPKKEPEVVEKVQEPEPKPEVKVEVKPKPEPKVESKPQDNEPIEVEDFDDDNDLAMKVKIGTKLNEPGNNKIIDKRLIQEEKKEPCKFYIN
jgi:hypothetical protein